MAMPRQGRSPMKFSKWHGLGNDYLVIDGRGLAAPVDASLVERACERTTGVGADGVLEVVGVEANRAEIVIWNPDGSQAELSGNGTRIAARWLARELDANEVEIAVGDRIVRARMLDHDRVEQELGSVHVGERETLDLDAEAIEFTPVLVGNPHAVVQHDPTEAEVMRLGPLIERHERFPERTNVQLVRVDARNELTVGVWERGAGLTASSGTSACAAAAAACAHGWVDRPVAVSLPGGVLEVALRDGCAQLTGPAQEICEGTLARNLLADLGRAP